MKLSMLCMLTATLAVQLLTASASTVYVSNSSSSSNTTSFLAALEDQAATQIILADDYYSVGTSFDAFVPGGGRGPLQIKRNVTVTAAQGPDTLLDLQFVRSAVELCSSCTFTFKSVAVGNDRRGPGGAVEFFLGQPGARVVFDDAVRFRPGCTTAPESGAAADATKRSIYFPNPDGKQQWTIRIVSFRGSIYPDQLFLIDHTVDDPRRVQEGRGPMGGVAVRTYNSSRVCRATVDPKCLEQRSSDACVNMLVDEVLASDAAGAAGSGAGRNTAGLAAGAAVAGVVVVGAILGALLWERRRRQLKQQQQLLPVADLPSKDYLKSAAASRHHRGTMDSDDDDTSDMDTNMGPGRRPDAPAGGGKGWELSWTLTTPLVPKDERDAPIELGELLGAGSFGRVFKGTWAGRLVAVKVISHDAESSEVVENEISLMLGFKHPNIVRAYHSLTYLNNNAGSARYDGKDSSPMNAINVAATTPAATGSFSVTRGPSATSMQDATASSTHGSQSHITNTPPNRPPELCCISTSAGTITQSLPSLTAAATAAGGGYGCGSSQPQQQSAATGSSTSTAASSSSCSNAQPAAAAGEQKVSKEAGTPTAADVRATSSFTGADRLLSGRSMLDATWGSSVICTKSSFGNNTTPLGRHSSGRTLLRAETWIVQEYCDVGTLDSVVSSWEGEEENDARMLERLLLLKDVASGLQVLHANNVVHGDLNARNVLVSSSTVAECGMVAKLADLGLSRAVKQNKTHRTTNTIGTMSHMPPELLRYGRMSTAVDIYAFGISMWEVYTGTPAFKKLHYGQFYELICLRNLRPLVPEGMPSDYQLLMENCWATEPTNRPTADRIIECLRYMIIERQRNLAAAVGGSSAQPDTPSAAAAAAAAATGFGAPGSPHFQRRPSLLERPLPQRGIKLAAANPEAATESVSAPLQPVSAAAAAAAAARRLSGSFHYGRPRSDSIDQEFFGGYTVALACPPGMYVGSAAGVGLDYAVGAQGTSAEPDDEGFAAGEGAGGKAVEPVRQLQQQSSFQDQMRWFV